jgi:hypothetical protein
MLDTPTIRAAADLTWLAYTLYADPLAKVVFTQDKEQNPPMTPNPPHHSANGREKDNQPPQPFPRGIPMESHPNPLLFSASL